MDDLRLALADYCTQVWKVSSHSALTAWDNLGHYPLARGILLAAIAIFIIYWFIDGIWNYQRRCLLCRGRGTFASKISKRRKRPCKCCNGTGVHLTVRKRLAQRLHRSSA